MTATVNAHRRLRSDTVGLTLKVGSGCHRLDVSLAYDGTGTLRENGHHEGYHGDDGKCLLAARCGCGGLPASCLTPIEDM